jgi:hypothetical protein
VIWSVKAPNIRYPSDAFPTVDGKQVIVADFWKPGRVVIFDPATRKITWEYFVKEGEGMLDHSSIARELPDTGDILVVDDLNDRVIVIDRKTKAIIWQYGEKGKKGFTPGLLNYPDGVDLDVFRDRTPDPQLRRLMLYPTELRAQSTKALSGPLFFELMVGAKGFEPSTLWSQTRCATRLRYAPTAGILTARKPCLLCAVIYLLFNPASNDFHVQFPSFFALAGAR